MVFLVHFGLKRSILVHLGPPTVLWPFLIETLKIVQLGGGVVNIAAATAENRAQFWCTQV